jgi:hypothetical protein
MNANLANYLFEKETLYRTGGVPHVLVEAETVAENVVAEKQVVQEKITAPKEEIAKPSRPTLTLKHKVLVLTEAISESEKAFLAKILTAVGLSLDQIDLVELSKIQTIDYQLFIMQNKTKKFISFGVGLGKLDWNILLNLYQIKNVVGVDFLLSDELRIVEADLTLKKALWTSLKQMFS